MFTPKRLNPIMLEDETVRTGTQKSRVYCSLPQTKKLLFWAFGKREVECGLSTVTPMCSSGEGAGEQVRGMASVGVVVTLELQLLASCIPAVDSKGRPRGRSGHVMGVMAAKEQGRLG